MNSLALISKCSALTAASVILLGLAAGCSSVGHISGQTGTDVQLSQNNYKMIAPGAIGKSYGFKVLGIIPFASPKYAAAKSRLYRSVDVPLTGKAVALANQTEDRSTLYLILFSVPKLTLTADVIEFTSQPMANPSVAE